MKNNVLHRDLKLENMLIHFPKRNLLEMGPMEKQNFLRENTSVDNDEHKYKHYSRN